MAFETCPYHSNNPRWSYFLYSNFRGPASDVVLPGRIEGAHRIIRGGPWHEWLGWPGTGGPARYNGNGWIVRGDPTSNDMWARIWLRGLANGVLETDIRAEGPAPRPRGGLCFRVADDNSCLVAYFDGTSCTINLGWAGASHHPTLIASAPLVSLGPDVTYHIEVDFHGPIVKVSMDGVEYIAGVTYFNILQRGVGLWTGTAPLEEQQFTRFRLRRG